MAFTSIGCCRRTTSLPTNQFEFDLRKPCATFSLQTALAKPVSKFPGAPSSQISGLHLPTYCLEYVKRTCLFLILATDAETHHSPLFINHLADALLSVSRIHAVLCCNNHASAIQINLRKWSRHDFNPSSIASRLMLIRYVFQDV